jgi:hypothetical protein
MTTHRNAATPSAWRIDGGDGRFRLTENGRGRLLVGGQVHNSSSSSREAIGRSFAHAAAVGANTVLAPVSWGAFEPAEGEFDVSLVDAMLERARHLGLRLVLLWFGAFKNAGSTYAPRWVRSDRERFPRVRIEPKGLQAFTYEGAMPKPVLSVFGEQLLDSDARAFEALIRHLREADQQDTVVMVQVENESGLLSDSRDRSDVAERAWSAPVPDVLLDHLHRSASDGSTVRAVWERSGARAAGSWPEVFGDGWEGDEVFMAWGFARYAERLAAAGKRIKAMPFYVNAWLGPQPGQAEAGQYPSGGPGSRVLDVWRLAAPSLDLICPDIYIQDAESAMKDYATGAQPFFVPECRLSAPELVRSIGCYAAIGWSGFGVDDVNPEGQVAGTLTFLRPLEEDIADAAWRGEVAAVVLEHGQENAEVTIAGLRIVVRDSRELLRRMLLDAGVSIPTDPLDLPDETAAGAMMSTPADGRPFVLLVRSAGSVTAVGRGVTLDFFEDGAVIEIDEVEELLVDAQELRRGRELNGDERLRILPDARVGAARVRLLST